MRRSKRFKDDKKHTDVEKADLQGFVKQAMMTTYKAHLRSGELVRGKIEVDYSGRGKNYIVTYNEQGSRIEEKHFGTYGSEHDTYDDTKNT